MNRGDLPWLPKDAQESYRVKGAVPSWIPEHPHQDPPRASSGGGPRAGHKRPLGQGPVVR